MTEVITIPSTQTFKSKPKTKQVDLGNIGKVLITEQLKRQVDYLHAKCKNNEWSGILVYKHSGGDIKNLKDLEFTALDFYLMDIGSGTLTEFKYGSEIVDVCEVIPEAMEYTTGLMHSHHSMGAFHSGTDMDELENNAEVYNYYLSLVVDTKDTWKCKVAFPAKVKSQSTTVTELKDTNGEVIEATNNGSKEEVVHLIGDLTVEYMFDIPTVPQWVVDRYETIKEEKSRPAYAAGFYRGYGGFRDDWDFMADYRGGSGFSNAEANTVPTYRQGNLFRDTPERKENLIKEGDDLSEDKNSELNIKRFENAILFADHTMPLKIGVGIASLKMMPKYDLDMYFAILESNIEILHDNIYGTQNNRLLLDHISQVVDKLQTFATPGYGKRAGKTKNNVDLLIEFLEEYGLTN